MLLIAFGALFLVTRDTGDSADDGVGLITPTAAPPVTPSPVVATPTAVPTPIVTIAPTAPPQTATPTPVAPAANISVAIWNPEASRWQSNVAAEGAYQEGQVVPLLVRLDSATPGATYEVSVSYTNCADPAQKGVDFLAGTESFGEAPLLTVPGPARVRPDSTVIIPDDPMITQDNETAARAFGVWGGAFQTAPDFRPAGPDCPEGQRVVTTVRAAGETVWVVLSGHLADSDEWNGRGAATSDEPIGIDATVAGSGSGRVELAPGSVTR